MSLGLWPVGPSKPENGNGTAAAPPVAIEAASAAGARLTRAGTGSVGGGAAAVPLPFSGLPVPFENKPSLTVCSLWPA